MSTRSGELVAREKQGRFDKRQALQKECLGKCSSQADTKSASACSSTAFPLPGNMQRTLHQVARHRPTGSRLPPIMEPILDNRATSPETFSYLL